MSLLSWLTKPVLSVLAVTAALGLSVLGAFFPATFTLTDGSLTSSQSQAMLLQPTVNTLRPAKPANDGQSSSVSGTGSSQPSSGTLKPVPCTECPNEAMPSGDQICGDCTNVPPTPAPQPAPAPTPQPSPDSCPPCSETPGHMICPMITCRIDNGSQF